MWQKTYDLLDIIRNLVISHETLVNGQEYGISKDFWPLILASMV